MNHSISVQIALIAISLATIVNGFECPKENEIGISNKCNCIPGLSYLICEDIETTFDFTKSYHFNSLILKNMSSIGNLLDHITRKHDLSTDNLVLLQDREIEKHEEDNLELVLTLPTKGIKIISPTGSRQVVNVEKFKDTVETISLTNTGHLHNVGLSIYLERFKSLHLLQLINVTFPMYEPNTVIKGVPLTEIELRETNIQGSFYLFPEQCPTDESIHIYLDQNDGLTNFDFESLLGNDLKCDYYMEITNSLMDSNFLEAQANYLVSKIPKVSSQYLYLQLRDTPINCGCGMVNLKDNSAVQLHGVFCKEQDKFFDQFTADDIANLHCDTTDTTPNPTEPTTTTTHTPEPTTNTEPTNPTEPTTTTTPTPEPTTNTEPTNPTEPIGH